MTEILCKCGTKMLSLTLSFNLKCRTKKMSYVNGLKVNCTKSLKNVQLYEENKIGKPGCLLLPKKLF